MQSIRRKVGSWVMFPRDCQTRPHRIRDDAGRRVDCHWTCYDSALLHACYACCLFTHSVPLTSHQLYASNTMQRSDVVLTGLREFLRSNHNNSNKIILAAASDNSSLLPCCKQSLGFKNAQISKLWSSAHWKNDDCRDYWKDIHLVCVRKYRPNSTYAHVEEVRDVCGDEYAFLHELPPATSPLKRVSSKTVLGARSPSTFSTNAAPPPRRLRSVSSMNKISTGSPKSTPNETSPSQPVGIRASTKPRASEPLLSIRAPQVRSPIITRRRSNTALQAQKLSVSPQPPLPSLRSSAARSPNTLSPSNARPLTRKVSDSSLAVKPSRNGRLSTGAAPRSVSGSAIPTPVRRASGNLLSSIMQDSPGSPSLLRASVRQKKVTPVPAPAPTISVATQTDIEPDPLILELAELEAQYDRLKVEHETTLAYTRELGLENQRLRKQRNISSQENEKLKDDISELEETVRELRETNEQLADQNSWIVVSKSDLEEKKKALQAENEALMAQFLILSNQRKELELNDALDEISRLQVEAAAATLLSPKKPTQSHMTAATPLKTPVTRFKEALDPVTVYKTPYMTPVKQTGQAETAFMASSAMAGAMTPVKMGTPTVRSVNASARKIRTPLTASAKRGKHGLRFWKRMAKRRMFA
ncbi:hypothetical protein P389DRAFT_16946 [Cystobasidium minutum MCA 4210]|uniref:uncharacterized protein n=1 Tax=Cystobasidium minutum MCA 4210 TaxID=1397322 RepID=UPI0034CD640E|eukprot:jgi/Rhomi1/16946/CE16945_325